MDTQGYRKDEVSKSDPMNTARDLLGNLLDAQFDDIVSRYVPSHDRKYINLKETRSQIINNLITYGNQREGECIPRLLEIIYTVAPVLKIIK